MGPNIMQSLQWTHFKLRPVYGCIMYIELQALDKLQLQLDFQLASEDGADTASFIPNGEWALLG